MRQRTSDDGPNGSSSGISSTTSNNDTLTAGSSRNNDSAGAAVAGRTVHFEHATSTHLTSNKKAMKKKTVTFKSKLETSDDKNIVMNHPNLNVTPPQPIIKKESLEFLSRATKVACGAEPIVLESRLNSRRNGQSSEGDETDSEFPVRRRKFLDDLELARLHGMSRQKTNKDDEDNRRFLMKFDGLGDESSSSRGKIFYLKIPCFP